MRQNWDGEVLYLTVKFKDEFPNWSLKCSHSRNTRFLGSLEIGISHVSTVQKVSRVKWYIFIWFR